MDTLRNGKQAAIEKKKPVQSWMSWSWIVMMIFLVLSLIHSYFAFIGLACMVAPLALAIGGKGKRHCSHYCPRGSFFGKFLKKISFNKKMPEFMTRRWFKHLMLILMFSVFGLMLYMSGGQTEKIAGSIFVMMTRTMLIGGIIGIIFLPRSWCKICPMGHAAGLIKEVQTKKQAN